MCTFVIVPLSRQYHCRCAPVHGVHQAASHIPALDLPSWSRYSFTDPERMEGWVSPGPGCKQQLAHGCYATACGQQDSNPWPRGRWSSVLTTRLSCHPWSMPYFQFSTALGAVFQSTASVNNRRLKAPDVKTALWLSLIHTDLSVVGKLSYIVSVSANCSIEHIKANQQ